MAAPAPTPPAALLTCVLCGQRFDPAENAACRACPLHAGCDLARCPSCGYETIDTRRSRLAGWAAAIASKLVRRERQP